MSSNTNIGNTPVNQGYVQLIHTGETGGIDGTLRTLYDGDGTASDLQIASNKVKVSTELYIGSKTATEFIQDIVGDMFTTGSYTNITTTYDDTNGNIDLSASGEVTLTGTQTLTNKTLASPTFTGTANGANLTLTGDLTVSGDTIFTNSNTVLIGDAILTLNADETGSPTANAGFEVERGTSTNKTFIWNETDDKWTIGSETFVASTVEANLTGNVTGNVTGSASLNLLKSSNLSDLANVATARTNLGVDVAGTDNSTDVTLVTTSHDYLSLAGQAITLGTIDISDDTNLVGGTGITLTGDTLSTTDSEIVHDNLSGFVANEHKDHSAISITTAASSGLSGGGDITTTRSLSVDVNNLDVQVPALELADKIAIYDNSATETNVATLTQLKAIVNTDTDTNQLTTFNVSGDSGTDQTISHNNTLTISGGNGISTSTSATDILSVALGGFSTLIAQSSPAEQDLLVIEEAIGGAIKKVQIGALSSGITIDGTTANGILTYGGVDNIDTESNLTFDGSTLALTGDLNVDSNTLFVDSSADSVGIGTNSPDRKLTVTGGAIVTAKFASTSGTGHLVDMISDNATDGYNGFRFYEQTNFRMALSHIQTGTRGYMQIGRSWASGNEILVVDGDNSRVGIGTNSPSNTLEVKSGSTTPFGIKNAINSTRLQVSLTNDDADIFLYDRNTTLQTALRSEGDSYFNQGNVGIGTNSPAEKLHIVSASGDARILLDAPNGSDTEIKFFNAGAAVWTLGHDDGSGAFRLGTFNVDNGVAINVATGGNVGIGTTSPETNLHIGSGTQSVAALAGVGIANGASAYSFFSASDGTKQYIAGIDNTLTYSKAGTLSNHDHSIITNNVERIYIKNTGNVGIGTDSPATKLHIQNGSTSYTWTPWGGTTAIFEGTGSGDSVVSIVAPNTGQSSVWFGDTDHQSLGRVRYEHANNQMEFWTNGIERVAIDSSGNVGIGVALPSAKLEVNGDLEISPAEPTITLNRGNGSYSWKIVNGAGTGSYPLSTFNIANNAGTPVITALDSGNVGIGVTSPAYKLQVSGGDIGIDVGERLYFGGGNHTYISEDVDDRLRFFVGGAEFMRFTESTGNSFSIYEDVYIPDDKKIHFGGGNDLKIYHFNAAGDSRINVANNPLLITYNDVDRFRLASGDLVINEGGGDYNFRVEGDTDANLLFVDAGTDRVGIGVGTPTNAKLVVSSTDSNKISIDGGSSQNGMRWEAVGGANTFYLFNGTFGTAGFGLYNVTTANAPLWIQNGGNVGIGNTSPAQKLHTNGTAGDTRTRTSTSNHGTYFESGVTADSAGILLVAGHASSILNIYLQGAGGTQNQFRFTHNGDFLADEDIVAYSTSVGSDRKLKDNIKDTSYGLSDVMKMRAVEFDWKEKRDKAHDIGVIAQEIEEIIPEVVKEVETLNTDGETHKVVDYAKLSSVLIKAIQEQQEQINKLEEKLNG